MRISDWSSDVCSSDLGKWNIEEKDSAGRDTRLRLSLKGFDQGIEAVSFPYFGGIEHDHWTSSKFEDVLERNIPVRKLQLADGRQWAVATVYDMLLAQYGVDRGFGGGNHAESFDDNIPETGRASVRERVGTCV